MTATATANIQLKIDNSLKKDPILVYSAMPSTFMDCHGKYLLSPEKLAVVYISKNVSATFCNAMPTMQVLLSFPKKFFIITGWTNKTSELIRLF
jgi:hypothetical protein